MADAQSRTGVRYASEAILAWLDRLHAPHDDGLARAFEAPAREGLPAIQVGVSEGRFLELLLRLSGARRVVEIGTLAGYSALRIARALPPDGRLWTFEVDERHARVATAVLGSADVLDRVTIVVGDAVTALAGVEANGPFDAVFVDADKERYDVYGRWAAKHLRRGGLLLGDNAYLFGELLEDSPRASAMRRFHEEATESFETVCIPTPDGLLLGVRR